MSSVVALGNTFWSNCPNQKFVVSDRLKGMRKARFYSSLYITHLNCASEKLESIREHLGDRWVPRTILTNDKTFAHRDILIDDHPAIKGAHTPSWKQFVFDRPYNRHLDLPRMSEWRNWREAVLPMLESTFAMR